MNELINFFIKNKEWLFSGIGVVIITTVISSLKSRYKYKGSKVYNISLLKDNIRKVELNPEPPNNKKSKVDLVIERFIKIYEAHGIQQNQIPDFIDSKFKLKLKDFKNNDSILQVLDKDLIEWTCEKFGVKRDWIDSTTDEIYVYTNFYKQVEAFINNICELKREDKKVEIFAFKEGELNRDDENQYVTLLIRYPIGKINSKNVYKYIPVSTHWRWGYWRSRFQLKAIFYICSKLRISIKGFDLKERGAIADGVAFPEVLIEKIPATYSWYPEDYIDSIYQSVQAKEIDETKRVKEYIKQERYKECLKNNLKVSKENGCL